MTEKQRVPALSRSFKILEVLQKNPHCTISDLIALTKLPRSSVYVLVEEMINLKILRLNQDRSLQLWMKLISLGNSAQEHLNLREIVTPHLVELMNSFDCLAVHFGIMDGDKAYYAVKITSPKAGMIIMSREGAEISLVHAGIGKCLLAYQNSDLRERLTSSMDYTPATPSSITSAQALRKELATIRLQGWAFDNSEGEAEIRCVAVPVFDQDGNLLGAVSIVGTVSKFSEKLLSKLVKKSQSCAASITESLML